MNGATLLNNLTSAGVTLWINGERLRYRAPKEVLTADMRAAMLTHKAELVEALRPADPAPPVSTTTTPLGDEVAIVDDVEYDPPAPCPDCRGLVFWWSPTGKAHCFACDSPRTAVKALEHARRIRHKLGMPANERAEKILADLQTRMPSG